MFKENLTNFTHTTGIGINAESYEFNYIEVFILIVISIVIIVGNILVLIALHEVRKFESTTKLFIFSLCIADLMVGTILIPLRMNEIFYTEWSRTISWCKLSISMNILNLSASSLNLLALTMEKLLFLWKPIQYEQIVTRKRSMIVLLCVWSFSFGASFVPIFSGLALRGNITRDQHDFMCKYATTLTHTYMTFMCIGDVVPLLLFGLAHYQIFRTANNHVHKLQSQMKCYIPQSEHKRLKKRERKNSMMLTTLVLVFYVCWIPGIIADILSITHDHLVTPTFIFAISALVYLNSFLNSMVYYFFNNEFRKSYQRHFCFWKRKKLMGNTQFEFDTRATPSPSLSTHTTNTVVHTDMH